MSIHLSADRFKVLMAIAARWPGPIAAVCFNDGSESFVLHTRQISPVGAADQWSPAALYTVRSDASPDGL